ncbi:MAG: insulinase family protein [Clostridia bacterium]|nr:insulinase family protein [Clostridia bacterium]
MLDLTPGSVHHGFRVVRNGEVPLLNTHYTKLVHEATGATLYYTDRDDGQMIFSVGFRTLPEDDTGVFHILEHSCLDGSLHYPLKEPFVNLIKTSMAVDLNAMTYEDKTIYYFISTNERDYMNLMSVYLDAVFYPLLLQDRRIFEKEAWHLEPDGEGGVSISGVVFNEMQGNDNHPDYLMWLQNEKQIFPDLGYHTHNSGGDPAAIPNLTYEGFVKTYERFYSPTNAIFYLSGNMGLEEELSHIDAVLTDKGTGAQDKPAPAPLQAPVISPEGSVYYQIADTEEVAGNTRLMLTYVLGADKPQDVLAFQLLSRYLAENTESPLSGAVLNADVGMDFAMACDGDCRQPMLYFTLGKTDPEQAEPFRRVILDTLERLVQEGLDARRLADLISSHETDCRRASLSVSTGFRLMESFIRTQVQYDDVLPCNDLADLRAALEADPQYFEHLIDTYILKSNHWGLTKCIPSRTVAAEKRERMAERCAGEAARVNATEGGYQALEAHMEAFNAYLTAPDSPEDEASVPHLAPSDINTTSDARDMAAETVGVGKTEATSLSYITDTNGMVLAGLLFDLSVIAPDDLFYARCLRDALFSLPTTEHTVQELTDRWISLHTNIHAGLRVEINDKAYFALTLDCPEHALAAAMEQLYEYFRAPVYDKTVLSRLFSSASAIRNAMVSSGNRTALRLATRTMSVAGMYEELTAGESAYRRLAALADHFDEHADELVAGMARVWEALISTVKPLVHLTGSEAAYATWKTALATAPIADRVSEETHACTLEPMERHAYALTVPGEVNYCVEAFDLRDVGLGFSPRHQVINTHIFSRYFWDEIRAKGGAYGASAISTRAGVCAFLSYRDPRVADTYAVYASLADWLDATVPDEEAIGAMIVSTLGSSYFVPRSPLDHGQAALSRYLIGLTAKDRQADIEDILATKPADFTAYANTLRALRASGRGIVTAVGNADQLRRSGLFAEDELVEL